ncbi:hypothetical protein ACQEVF_11800 [Nonomuraea polychroma]|uniref:hypothetical protein n=1 Tax=Nonomuraea polychroma TaxID=46176 RepID=UPI003D92BCEE
MKKLLKTAAVGAIVVASSFAMAQPAMASDLSWNVSDGLISYADSTNKFCVRAYDSEGARQVKATLNGYVITDKNNYYGDPGGTCIYLNAYAEGARLVVSASTYWGERGTWVGRGSRTFYR